MKERMATALFLIVMLAINYFDHWLTTSALWSALWMLSAMPTLLFLGASFVTSRDLLQRPADAAVLRRMTRLLRWPALAGLLVFSAGTLDPHLSSLLGRSTTQQLHVERVLCQGTGLRPSLPVQSGLMCFAEARNTAARQGRSIIRVDADLVPPSLSVGDAGVLTLMTIPSGLLTAQRYTKPVNVDKSLPSHATTD